MGRHGVEQSRAGWVAESRVQVRESTNRLRPAALHHRVVVQALRRRSALGAGRRPRLRARRAASDAPVRACAVSARLIPRPTHSGSTASQPTAARTHRFIRLTSPDLLPRHRHERSRSPGIRGQPATGDDNHISDVEAKKLARGVTHAHRQCLVRIFY